MFFFCLAHEKVGEILGNLDSGRAVVYVLAFSPFEVIFFRMELNSIKWEILHLNRTHKNMSVLIHSVTQHIKLALQTLMVFELLKPIPMFIIKMQSLIILHIILNKLWHSRIQSTKFRNLEKLNISRLVNRIHNRSLFNLALRVNQSLHSQTDTPNREIFAINIGLFGQIDQQFDSFHILGLLPNLSFRQLQKTALFFFFLPLKQSCTATRDQKSIQIGECFSQIGGGCVEFQWNHTSTGWF